MNVAIAAGLFFLLLVLFKYYINLKSKKNEGKRINKSIFREEIQKLLNSTKSILYFYTPTCGACKTQAPIIEKLAKEIKFVGKIDLFENRDAAKEFGIMGTPTTVLMKENKIVGIFVGLQKADFLKTKFNEI